MLIKGLRKSLTFGAGTAVGGYCVLKMDDMVYSQLKRHVVIPFQVLTNSQNITVDDLKEVSSGANAFAKQFKPLAMKK
jgi:hypothetical protein